MTNPAHHAARDPQALSALTSSARTSLPRARTHSVGWAHRLPVVALLAPLVLGCDKPSAPSAAASASAASSARAASSAHAAEPSAAPPAKLTLSCREEKRGARFLVGEVGNARPSSAERLSAGEAEAEEGEGD